MAFCRISHDPIWVRSAIKKADYLVVLDETVLTKASLNRIKDKGALILNTPKCPADIRKEFGIDPKKITVVTCDLTQIALDLNLTTSEQQPIVNTSVLGVITQSSLEVVWLPKTSRGFASVPSPSGRSRLSAATQLRPNSRGQNISTLLHASPAGLIARPVRRKTRGNGS